MKINQQLNLFLEDRNLSGKRSKNLVFPENMQFGLRKTQKC